MFRTSLFALSLIASPALAGSYVSPPPERIVIPVAVYGNDACPKAGENEIVVCARHPESDRYRVPAPLRQDVKTAADTAWSVKVEGMEDDARYLIPGSCTVVGPSGSTGCTQQMLREWFQANRTPDNR